MVPFTGQVILGYIRNLAEHECQQTVNTDPPVSSSSSCLHYRAMVVWVSTASSVSGITHGSQRWWNFWKFRWFSLAEVCHLQFSLFSLCMLLKDMISQLPVPSCSFLCLLFIAMFFSCTGGCLSFWNYETKHTLSTWSWFYYFFSYWQKRNTEKPWCPSVMDLWTECVS